MQTQNQMIQEIGSTRLKGFSTIAEDKKKQERGILGNQRRTIEGKTQESSRDNYQ